MHILMPVTVVLLKQGLGYCRDRSDSQQTYLSHVISVIPVLVFAKLLLLKGDVKVRKVLDAT